MIKTAKKIMRKFLICDHCLGRQFGQLLTGMSNQERGRAIRTALAMEYEMKPFKVKEGNFFGVGLRKEKQPKRTCEICGDIFSEFQRFEKEIRKSTKAEYSTFLIGTNVNNELIDKEEALWRVSGIKYCEPIKSGINRELGKYMEKALKKSVDKNNPEVVFILDLATGKARVDINPLYVFGFYQKLKRGIPQTKWDMYPETVEDIIAKPFMKATKGAGHSLHATGREDIDARCLGWRPFVFQVDRPLKRGIDLQKMMKEINKTRKVNVKGLKWSSRKEVVEIKEARPEKTYRVVVEFASVPKGLDALKRIRSIDQKTPTRVMHRRADLERKRKIISLSWKRISGKRYEFVVRAEAGLYVKELVTGDRGRTRPSFSGALKNEAKVVELDVLGVHWKEKT